MHLKQENPAICNSLYRFIDLHWNKMRFVDELGQTELTNCIQDFSICCQLEFHQLKVRFQYLKSNDVAAEQLSDNSLLPVAEQAPVQENCQKPAADLPNRNYGDFPGENSLFHAWLFTRFAVQCLPVVLKSDGYLPGRYNLKKHKITIYIETNIFIIHFTLLPISVIYINFFYLFCLFRFWGFAC